jgi:DNA-binding NarL/FixJ family response regulator
LIRLGYEAEVTSDSSDALVLYKKAEEAGNPFDVVIIDLIIPGGMGGEELIKEFLAIDPDVRAIISSGNSLDPLVADYKRYGFRGAVAKPYTIEELTGVLNDVLGQNE